MELKIKLALLATCAGLLTACGGGSDTTAAGGGGSNVIEEPEQPAEPEPPAEPLPTVEEGIKAQNALVDQGETAYKAAKAIVEALTGKAEEENRDVADVLAETRFIGAQGRSVTVGRRAQAILTAYGDVRQEYLKGSEAYGDLVAIRENEDLSDAERENAKDLLEIAKFNRNQIDMILNPYEDENGMMAKSVLRQAYDKIIKDPDMPKNAAYHEGNAKKAVWAALKDPRPLPDNGLKGLVDKAGIVFATGDNLPNGAMTFAEIVGDGLVTHNVANVDYGAVSLDGMENAENATYAPTEFKDRAHIAFDYPYKGIRGSVICRGVCLESEDEITTGEEFGEGWFFVPVSFGIDNK